MTGGLSKVAVEGALPGAPAGVLPAGLGAAEAAAAGGAAAAGAAAPVAEVAEPAAERTALLSMLLSCWMTGDKSTGVPLPIWRLTGVLAATCKCTCQAFAACRYWYKNKTNCLHLNKEIDLVQFYDAKHNQLLEHSMTLLAQLLLNTL